MIKAHKQNYEAHNQWKCNWQNGVEFAVLEYFLNVFIFGGNHENEIVNKGYGYFIGKGHKNSIALEFGNISFIYGKTAEEGMYAHEKEDLSYVCPS